MKWQRPKHTKLKSDKHSWKTKKLGKQEPIGKVATMSVRSQKYPLSITTASKVNNPTEMWKLDGP